MKTYARVRELFRGASFTLLLGCGNAAPADPGERELSPARPATGGENTGGGAQASDTLKLASWNVAWLNRKLRTGPVKRTDQDYARLQRYAEQLDADVIALQEVDGAEAAARVFDPERYEFHFSTQTQPQRTGFAYRRGLSVEKNPDYAALDVGDVRVGADLTVHVGGRELRLLSVHLKAGCIEDALTSSKKDCRKLAAQVPSLEAWIDARAAENMPAAVMGDFNRRLFRANAADELWTAIDDAEPPASDLRSASEGRTSRCWNGEHPIFIDHIVLNAPASAFYLPDSFEEQIYDDDDAAWKSVLSDHCPVAVRLAMPTSP